MQQQKAENQSGEHLMHRRQIRMEDGRYMIFYTFGADGTEAGGITAEGMGNEGMRGDTAGTEPKAPDTEAGEERHV